MSESNNVYKRLQKTKAELSLIPIKESGNNTFAKYTYLELGDFLPHIVRLCDANGICPIVLFGETEATLTIFNVDKPDENLVFSSPMASAELKGCHAIQNMGAIQTYLRRYLYMSAFDVVENDILNASGGADTKPKPPGGNGESSPKLFVNADELITLRDLFNQAKVYNEASFCQQSKIAKLEDLESHRYQGAFNYIQGIIAKETAE